MPKPEHTHNDHENEHLHQDDNRSITDALKELTEVERQSLAVLNLITDQIKGMSQGCASGRRATGFGFKLGLITKKTKERKMPLELKLTNEQQVKVTLSPKTDTNKPTTVQGAPAWVIISGNASVVVADDGLSAMLISNDQPGDTEILVKADADLGDGVEEISDVIKLSVVGATAKNLGLAAGTPEAKP